MQVHKEKPAKSEAEQLSALPGKSDQGEALKSELDAILDEIDGVLEENAAAFVAAFRQKPGE